MSVQVFEGDGIDRSSGWWIIIHPHFSSGTPDPEPYMGRDGWFSDPDKAIRMTHEEALFRQTKWNEKKQGYGVLHIVQL